MLWNAISAEQARELDVAKGEKQEGFEVRLGPPWPMIRCLGCKASRHCEGPACTHGDGEGGGVDIESAQEYVLLALVKFRLEHEGCARHAACVADS